MPGWSSPRRIKHLLSPPWILWGMGGVLIVCLWAMWESPPPGAAVWPSSSVSISAEEGSARGETGATGRAQDEATREEFHGVSPVAHHAVSESEGGQVRPADGLSERALRERIVGTWELRDSIQRVAAIRADGTATMHVVLDPLSALLYGPEMTLTLEWSLAEGVLTHQLVGGTPHANVQRLMRDWGNQRSYQVLSLTDDEMLLRSTSDGEEHRWRRVPQSPSGPTFP